MTTSQSPYLLKFCVFPRAFESKYLTDLENNTIVLLSLSLSLSLFLSPA